MFTAVGQETLPEPTFEVPNPNIAETGSLKNPHPIGQVLPGLEPSPELEHDGRKCSVTVNDFRVLQCQRCGAIVLDDSANETLSRALRREAGLLGPEEIHANREKHRLTQKQLASYLRISESTLSRWETGAQIQQRAMDALLRVFFDSSEARSILAGSSGAVPNPLQTRIASMPPVGVEEAEKVSGTVNGPAGK